MTQRRPLGSKVICTALARSGNCSSEAKRLILRFLAGVILAIASLPLRKTCSPLGPAPGRLVLTGIKDGVFESLTVRSPPLRDRPNPFVAVGRHNVQDLHFPIHDDAVRLAVYKHKVGATAENRIAVDRPITIEEVKILIDHGGANLGKRRGVRLGSRAEKSGVDRRGDSFVAEFVEMNAVDRQRPGGLDVKGQAWLVKIDKENMVLLRRPAMASV